MTEARPIGLAVVGAGYWGPNLVRNALASAHADLHYVVDVDLARAERVASPYAGVVATSVLAQALDDPRVEAVAIATPASTHLSVALEALEAGKHVMVEK